MAKRASTKPKPKVNLDETLPPDVEYVTVKVPVYTGELQRPRCLRVDLRFSDADVSEVVTRMHVAMSMLLKDQRLPNSMNLTFRSLLKSVAGATK